MTRPFTPIPPPPLPVTLYDVTCAIAKAPTEEFLIFLLRSAVNMKAPAAVKRGWANTADARIRELKKLRPQFVKVSPAEAFPDVKDDRPISARALDIAELVNGNREIFCAEHDTFTFEGAGGRTVTIHEHFNATPTA